MPEQGFNKRTNYGQQLLGIHGTRHEHHRVCMRAYGGPDGGLLGLNSLRVVQRSLLCCLGLAVGCNQARALPWGRVRLAVFLSAACQPVAYLLLRCIVQGPEALKSRDHVQGAAAFVVGCDNKQRQPAVCAFAFYLQGPSQAQRK